MPPRIIKPTDDNAPQEILTPTSAADSGETSRVLRNKPKPSSGAVALLTVVVFGSVYGSLSFVLMLNSSPSPFSLMNFYLNPLTLIPSVVIAGLVPIFLPKLMASGPGRSITPQPIFKPLVLNHANQLASLKTLRLVQTIATSLFVTSLLLLAVTLGVLAANPDPGAIGLVMAAMLLGPFVLISGLVAITCEVLKRRKK